MTASYYPKHFLLKALSNYKIFCFADSRIFCFCQVLESIHKFIIELHFLQCLYVMGSNKKMSGNIFSNFTKGEIFHHLWQPSALGGNRTMWSPSSVWPGTEYNRALIWNKSLLICFESYHGMVFPIPLHRQSWQENGEHLLLMVNSNPVCKR